MSEEINYNFSLKHLCFIKHLYIFLPLLIVNNANVFSNAFPPPPSQMSCLMSILLG